MLRLLFKNYRLVPKFKFVIKIYKYNNNNNENFINITFLDIYNCKSHFLR